MECEAESEMSTFQREVSLMSLKSLRTLEPKTRKLQSWIHTSIKTRIKGGGKCFVA